MQTTQQLKEQLNKKLADMANVEVLNDSNYKFMVLLHSRLIENHVPVDAAFQIAAYTDYDMSFLNEEDDFVGDIALLYGEFCAKVYHRLKAVNFHRQLDSPTIRKLFNPLGGIKPQLRI